MLWRKLMRDLSRQRWQTLAIVIVLCLGTAVFIACLIGYESLGASYQAAQERTRLADLSFDVALATPEDVEAVQQLPEVERAIHQVTLDIPILFTGRTQSNSSRIEMRSEGRLISIPVNAQPELNQLVLVAGTYPTDPREILVERHFADFHGLSLGEPIRFDTPAGPFSFTVKGIAVSAEYLWVAKSAQDFMPSPADFGVFFMPREGMAELARQILPEYNTAGLEQSTFLAGLKLASDSSLGNRVLCQLKPGSVQKDAVGAVTAAMGSDRVLKVTPKADLVGIRLLQQDVDTLKQVAGLIPAFFLSVVALIIASMVSRQVDQERPLIGTMMAIGVPHQAILIHYLTFGLAVGLIGTSAGSVAGILLGGLLAKLYAQELMIPFVAVQYSSWVIWTAVALGLAISVLACASPARRAAATEPAEAMRPFQSESDHGRHRDLPSWGRLPLWIRLGTRNLLRHPMRTLATVLGITAAVGMVIATAGSYDSVRRWVDLNLDMTQRYDLRADLTLPQPMTELEQQLKGRTGLLRAEGVLYLPIQVKASGGSSPRSVVLQVLPKNSLLMNVCDQGGVVLHPAPTEAILTEATARHLGLHPGDTFQIQLPPSGSTVSAVVAALSGTSAGEMVTIMDGELAQGLGIGGFVNSLFLTIDPLERDAIRSQLGSLPSVARITTIETVRERFEELLGLTDVILIIFLLCGAILAGAILFNTTTLNILERRRELATMLTLGMPLFSLASVLTWESLLSGLAGLLIGWPIGMRMLRLIVASVESDILSLPYWIDGATVGLACSGIMIVLLLAQMPALRQVARMNVAEAAKSRE